jgi:hypothetical protein
VVSVADPCGRNLGFLDRSRYFFFQVAPQSYSEAEWTSLGACIHFQNSGNSLNLQTGLENVLIIFKEFYTHRITYIYIYIYIYL